MRRQEANDAAALVAESQKSLEFMSHGFDQFRSFKTHAKRELQRLSVQLAEVSAKVDLIGNAVHEIQITLF